MPLSDMTANALNPHEPQRQNNWLLYINIDGSDDLALALDSFPLPKRNVGKFELAHLNEKRHFAGNPVYDDMSIVFKDLVSNDIAGTIEDWWLEVHDETTGKIGFAADYKKFGYIVGYAPDGTLDRGFDLFGIFPTTFDPGEADQTAEDYTRINLTLSIDKVRRSTTPGVFPTQYPGS